MRTHLTLFIILICTGLSGQVRITLSALPDSTPLGDSIYISGNFNNWNPSDSSYRMLPYANGLLSIVIEEEMEESLLEYKFTRGSWGSAESTPDGAVMDPRTTQLEFNGSTREIVHQISAWQDQVSRKTYSTAAPNVKIIANDFYIPQLGKNRRIWIYLPPDYETSGKDYPVLYMHDGQDVFDSSTSFSGEWSVDESLNKIYEETGNSIIVVAIDHGGRYRSEELNPWVTKEYGGGRGQDYIDFIVKNLKPYIDAYYRTKRGPEHTGILGAELGGLISIYATLRHPETFSMTGMLSPSLWIADQVNSFSSNVRFNPNLKFFCTANKKDMKNMHQYIGILYFRLLKAGYNKSQLTFKIMDEGPVRELLWREEFVPMVTKMFDLNQKETE